jgi:hypothetical protein
MSVAMNPVIQRSFFLQMPVRTNIYTHLYASHTELWNLIKQKANEPDLEFPKDTEKLRKLAYEQGYVQSNGYTLTKLGQAFRNLLQ